jgi:hypothetical protein
MGTTTLGAIVAGGGAVDRTLVTALVEERWKAIMAAEDGAPTLAVREDFDRRIQEAAAMMEPIHADPFLQMVAEEEQRIINEHIKSRVEMAEVTELVENHYRTFIPVVENHPTAAAAVISGFVQRTDYAAKQMGPAQGAAYLQKIEAEDARLAAEYMADKAAFKRRLGIAGGKSAVANHGYADLAIRTAIRASIWEGLARLLFGAWR